MLSCMFRFVESQSPSRDVSRRRARVDCFRTCISGRELIDRRCRKLPSKRRQFAGILFAGAAAGSQLSLLLEHNARRSPFGGFTRCCAHSCLRPQNAIAARRADPAPAPTQRRHRAAAKHHGRGPNKPKFNSSRPRPAPVGDRAETKGREGRPVLWEPCYCHPWPRRKRTR